MAGNEKRESAGGNERSMEEGSRKGGGAKQLTIDMTLREPSINYRGL
jgi:hypothetical protein